MTNEKLRMYRQGDILLVEVKAVPNDAYSSKDRVLALGEVTGHTHRIDGQVSIFRRSRGEERPDDIFLSVTSGQLIHDEHGPIQVPQGLYQVRRQREYEPGMARLVQD